MSLNRIFKIVIHYKLIIEANVSKPEVVLQCIEELSKVPVEARHIQYSGIMETLRELPPYEGQCGTSVKLLMRKWKSLLVKSVLLPASKNVKEGLDPFPLDEDEKDLPNNNEMQHKTLSGFMGEFMGDFMKDDEKSLIEENINELGNIKISDIEDEDLEEVDDKVTVVLGSVRNRSNKMAEWIEECNSSNLGVESKQSCNSSSQQEKEIDNITTGNPDRPLNAEYMNNDIVGNDWIPDQQAASPVPVESLTKDFEKQLYINLGEDTSEAQIQFKSFEGVDKPAGEDFNKIKYSELDSDQSEDLIKDKLNQI